MGMVDQDREFESLFAYLLDQRLAEPPNTGTGIQNNDLIANTDFDARSVSTVSGCFRARRWNRTAHAPKPDQSRASANDFWTERWRKSGFAVAAILGHRTNQFGRCDWFQKVIVGAGRECGLAIVGKPAHRHQDNASRFEAGLFANQAANLESIPSRGANIAKHGGRLVQQNKIQTGLAIFRLQHTPVVTEQTLGNKSPG